MKHLTRLKFCLIFSIALCLHAFSQDESEKFVLTASKCRELEKSVAGLVPDEPKCLPKFQLLPHKIPVLWGDLFENGHIYVITPLESKTAYLEWRDHAWSFVGVLDVQTAWVPEGGQPQEFGLSEDPPVQPYILRPLGPNHTPVLLIAYGADPLNLGWMIVIPKGDTHELKIVGDSYFKEPTESPGYLITYNQQGRRAWWSQNIYSKWSGGKLVKMVTWTEGNVEESDMGPTRFTLETTAASPVGKHDYRIMQKPEGAIIRDGKPFATVKFHWEKMESPAIIAPCSEELFLFEKLSGLPWKCFGDMVDNTDLKTTKDAYKYMTVKVSGDPQAVKMLSK